MSEHSKDNKAKAYFRANVKLITVLMSIWAFVSFGCGILLAPWLNGFNLRLGFQ